MLWVCAVCARVYICTGTYTGCVLCVHMCAFALGHGQGVRCVCLSSRLSLAVTLGQGLLSPDFPSREGTFLEGQWSGQWGASVVSISEEGMFTLSVFVTPAGVTCPVTCELWFAL